LLSEVNARELKGRQVKLIDQELPPGDYPFLEIRFRGMSALVGRALVRPPFAPDSVRIPLPARLDAGRCLFLPIEWRSQEFDPEKEAFSPAWSLGRAEVPPVGSLAIVSNEDSNNLTVVDLTDRRVRDVIMTSQEPRGMAYAERDELLYVACATGNALDVIDLPTRIRTQTVSLRLRDEPSRLVVSPDEERVHLLCCGSSLVITFESRSLQELWRAVVGEGARDLIVDPESDQVIVSCELSGDLRILDPFSGLEISRITTVATPGELCLHPNSRNLLVASALQRLLYVVEPATGKVITRMSLCSPAVGLAFDARSGRLYASQGECREIALLRPESGLDVGSIRFNTATGLPTLDPDLGILLVPLPGDETVAFVNTTRNQQVDAIEVGRGPYMVVVPR
jgi:DNA-binding beta-propeller fold protein YncE